MTDEEIIESYRRAKYPDRQIRIISELTLRPKADIIKVLEGAGFMVSADNKTHGWSKKQEETLMAAKAQGKSYREIAKIIGKSSISCLKKYRRLTEAKGGG